MYELPLPVQHALQKLRGAGIPAYIVGGSVRDLLLGNVPKDYDIAAASLPEQTEQCFSGCRIIETGLKHGTVTVLFEGLPLEITTFRTDGDYTDHRHPASVSFTRSIEEDLARRDYTVNAMALSAEGDVIDPFGGRDDLKNGLLRCVRNPYERFEEDALRIMRGLRFSSVLGFALEENTVAAMRAKKELMKAVSAERLSVELKLLLSGVNVREVLAEYPDILGVILPEILPCAGFDQKNRYHIHDVWTHTAHTVGAVRSRCGGTDTVLLLAALLHDIGKPACFTEDSGGTGHFYGHAEAGAEMTERLLARLRFDRSTVSQVTHLVRYHDTPVADTERSVRKALRLHGEELFFRLLDLKRADNAAHAPFCAEREPFYDTLETLARDILARNQCFSLKQLAVSGADLLAQGVPEGPEVGRMLNLLLNAVMEEKTANIKEALLEYLHFT